MKITKIEDEIASGNMNAAQVFTQMKRHIKETPDCIKINSEAINIEQVSLWLESKGMKSSRNNMPETGQYDWAGEGTLYIGTISGLLAVFAGRFVIYRGENDFVGI